MDGEVFLFDDCSAPAMDASVPPDAGFSAYLATSVAPKPRQRIDDELVLFRFRDAGETLLSMDAVSPSWPAEAQWAYGLHVLRACRSFPSMAAIRRMIETWAWLAHIADPAHRRVIVMRGLASPLTHRPLLTWADVARHAGLAEPVARFQHMLAVNQVVAGLQMHVAARTAEVPGAKREGEAAEQAQRVMALVQGGMRLPEIQKQVGCTYSFAQMVRWRMTGRRHGKPDNLLIAKSR